MEVERKTHEVMNRIKEDRVSSTEIEVLKDHSQGPNDRTFFLNDD